MLRTRTRNALLWVSLGLLLGLSAGLAVHIGIDSRRSTARLPLEELKLQASASHGADTFAMATGIVDDTEAVFMLDYLTGELQCYVINPRTAKFGAMFKTNVWKEMPVAKGKGKPSYVMCTGTWSYKGGSTGGGKFGDCVVYVADANTGDFAAYSVLVTGNGGTISTLGFGKARDLKLRE